MSVIASGALKETGISADADGFMAAAATFAPMRFDATTGRRICMHWIRDKPGGRQGRFKWSSQRFMRSYDDQMEAAIGSFW